MMQKVFKGYINLQILIFLNFYMQKKIFRRFSGHNLT